jgi:hypothetical protein
MLHILIGKIKSLYFGVETTYIKSITKNFSYRGNEPDFDSSENIAEYEGRKILVIDLEKHFFHRTGKWDKTEIIILSFSGCEFAILIEEIKDIFPIPKKDILPIPPYAERYMSEKFFRGLFSVNGQLVLLMDILKITQSKSYYLSPGGEA